MEKQVVKRFPRISHLRECIYESNWLPWAYFVFIVGFFIVGSSKWHNNIYYVGVLLPFLLAFPPSRFRLFLGSRVYALSVLFCVYLVLTVFWSGQFRLSHLWKHGRAAVYVLCFLTLSIDLILRDSSYYEKLLRLFGWCAALGATLSVVIYYGGSHLDPRLQGLGRLDQNILGATVYGMVGMVAYYRFVVCQRCRGMTGVFWWVVISTCFIFVALTQSRGPALAILLTLLIGAFFLKQKKIAVIFLSVPLIYFLLVRLDFIELAGFFTRDSVRLEIWLEAFQDIIRAPWLGNGISLRSAYQTSIKVEPHAHSVFLASWVYGGVVALGLLLSTLFFAVRQGYGVFVEKRDFSLLAMLIFSILCCITDGHRLIANPRPMWLYFWFPIAIACVHELNLSKAERGARNVE
jgi:hypothetical protein